MKITNNGDKIKITFQGKIEDVCNEIEAIKNMLGNEATLKDLISLLAKSGVDNGEKKNV